MSAERLRAAIAALEDVVRDRTLLGSLTMEEQMRASLETIRDIVTLAGMNMEHIVDAHVYLNDIGQMDNMNTVFKEYFPKNPPVRTTVQASMENLVQVQAVAVR